MAKLQSLEALNNENTRRRPKGRSNTETLGKGIQDILMYLREGTNLLVAGKITIMGTYFSVGLYLWHKTLQDPHL